MEILKSLKQLKKYIQRFKSPFSQFTERYFPQKKYFWKYILFGFLYLIFIISAASFVYFYRLHFVSISLQTSYQEREDFPIFKNISREITKEYDLESDTSLQKYIDPNISFETLDYIPSDMRTLSTEFLRDAKGDLQLREEAASAFEKLSEAFFRENGEKVVVVSSYRSYSYQAGIKARGCSDILCAKAGYSEHQSGLALDIWAASSEYDWKNSPRLWGYYTWFHENAHLYGFHNSYQNGVEIDGYAVEPWHWRYLGVELATHLYEKDITFAEYYGSKKED